MIFDGLCRLIDIYNAGNYFHRGALLDEMGEDEKAIKDFEKAIELQPGFRDAKAAIKRIKAKRK